MFVTDLILDPMPKRQWRVVNDFHVETEAAGYLVIPAGFVCNMNSIPRFLWWVSTPTDYPEAGVIHDWGYRGNLQRDIADRVYAEVLTFMGMGGARSATRYMALRIFGRFAYKG